MYRPCASGALALSPAFPASSGLRLQGGQDPCARLSASPFSANWHITLIHLHNSDIIVKHERMRRSLNQHFSPHITYPVLFLKIIEPENLLWGNQQLLTTCGLFNYKNNQRFCQMCFSRGYNKNAVWWTPVGQSWAKHDRL